MTFLTKFRFFYLPSFIAFVAGFYVDAYSEALLPSRGAVVIPAVWAEAAEGGKFPAFKLLEGGTVCACWPYTKCSVGPPPPEGALKLSITSPSGRESNILWAAYFGQGRDRVDFYGENQCVLVGENSDFYVVLTKLSNRYVAVSFSGE